MISPSLNKIGETFSKKKYLNRHLYNREKARSARRRQPSSLLSVEDTTRRIRAARGADFVSARDVPMKRCLSMTLSLRGRRALKPLTSYFPAYLQAMERPWTNEDPEGSLALVVAENRLASSERIQSRIKEALCRVNQSESFFYSDYSGRPEFREALANHMSRNITRDTPFSADNLVVGTCKEHRISIASRRLTPLPHTFVSIGNGCGAVLDTLFWLIGNEGDEVLIPSPTYPAFKNDLNVRDGLKTVMVAPHVDDPTYLPLPEQLEAATTSKTAALLLTNPSNPLGIVHCPVRMTELIQWAADRDMHVVVDEIYASSIYDPANAYSFDSAWDIAAKLKKEQQHLVHVVYGLSKDFGVSGVRVGCIASRNTDLLRAFRDNLGYFCTVRN